MVGSRKLPLNAPVAGATFNFRSLLPTDDAVPVPFVAMDTLITMLFVRLPPPSVNCPVAATDGPPSAGEIYRSPVSEFVVENSFG